MRRIISSCGLIKTNTKLAKGKWVEIPFMAWVFAYRSSIISSSSSIIIIAVVVYHTLNKGVRRDEGRKMYIMKGKKSGIEGSNKDGH